ncbi:ABC transporter permease [Leifsonia sp. YAF41]|uniref:ABC transporter permease n=1 Tax=Leifsonia sp. YAF41 TaxID=3233086 RepID=UPI003F9BC6D2
MPRRTTPTLAGPRPGAHRLPARLAALGTLLALVGLIALFAMLTPQSFLTPPNLSAILEQVAVLAIVASVQTIVMAAGDVDLSVGALAGLVGVLVSQLLVGGMHPVTAILLGLGAGLLAGAINGLVVAYLGLSTFIATLATMTCFTGLALLLGNGAAAAGLPDAVSWLGLGRIGPVPVPVVIAVVVMLLAWFLLSATVLGRTWYAIGGNANAAKLSGLNTKLARFTAFALSGVGAALAGIVLTASLASGHTTTGDAAMLSPLMLSSIAAVLLGLTLSRTGSPTIGGTAVGLGIVGVLGNGLALLQMNSALQLVLTGVVILLALGLARLSRRRH